MSQIQATRVSKTYDSLLEAKDAGAITASAAATVDSVAKILNLGTGLVEGDLIVDISAIEVDSDDEKYTIGVQISSSATCASDIYEVKQLIVGSAGTAEGDNLGGDTDMGAGRYRVPFTNEIADGVTKQYMRVYCTIAGTIATGINYTAYVALR